MDNKSNRGRSIEDFQEQELKQNEPILSMPKLVGGVISNWPLFLVSFILFLGGTYFINRYADRIYEGNIILNIETNGGGDHGAGMEAIMTQIGYYNPRLTFENEVVKMKSYRLVESTLKKLDFGIEIVGEGRVRNSELYGSGAPFKVVIDSSHVQDIGHTFKITFLDDRNFSIIVLGQSKRKIFKDTGPNRAKSEIESEDSVDIKLRESYEYGEWIKGSTYKFKLIDVQNDILTVDRSFELTFRDSKSMTENVLNAITVSPVAKGSSVVEIKWNHSNQEKIERLLTAYVNTYIQMSLDEKNKVADSTISFIDRELREISDSLEKVEDVLQIFRSEKGTIDISTEGSIILEELFQLEKRLTEEKTKLKYYQFLGEYVVSKNEFTSIVVPSTIGISDPVLLEIISRLGRLYEERDKIRVVAKEGNSNPILREVESQISLARFSLNENLESIKGQSKIIVNDLKNRKSIIESKLKSFPKTERDLINIERRFELNQQ